MAGRSSISESKDSVRLVCITCPRCRVMEMSRLPNSATIGLWSSRGGDELPHVLPTGAARHRGEDGVNALGLREEMLRVGFLKVAAADFMAGDLRRDSEDGHTAAVTVVEAVDQMQISGTATAGAYRQGSRQVRRGSTANAAVSSCRTEIRVDISRGRVASVMLLRESPATP